MADSTVTDAMQWEFAESPDNVHQYVLHNAGAVLATLRFEHKREYDAVAEIAHKRLLFEKHLTVPYHIIVRDEASKAELARFDATIVATGSLQLAEGQIFKWTHHNIFAPEWAFENHAGNLAVDIKGKFGFGKPQSQVTLGPAAASVDVAFMAALGWYIILSTNLYPSYIANR